MGLPTSAEIEAFLENGVEETMMLGTKVCRIPGTTRFFPLLKGFDAERLQCQLSFSYLGRLAGSEAATRLPQYLSSLRGTPNPGPMNGCTSTFLPRCRMTTLTDLRRHRSPDHTPTATRLLGGIGH